jgi:hypothetical protein
LDASVLLLVMLAMLAMLAMILRRPKETARWAWVTRCVSSGYRSWWVYVIIVVSVLSV